LPISKNKKPQRTAGSRFAAKKDILKLFIPRRVLLARGLLFPAGLQVIPFLYLALHFLYHPPPAVPAAEATVKEKTAEKLKTDKGKAVYKKRKETAEPVFGIIKQAMGFRQFLLRGG
jgi:hypothetical protein